MKDEIFFRDKLEDEWEANEVYAILSECDKDFEPPLSELSLIHISEPTRRS